MRTLLAVDRLSLFVARLTGVLAACVLWFAWPLAAEPVAPGVQPADLLVVADLRGQALVWFPLDYSSPARRIALAGGPHELLRLPDDTVVASLEQRGELAVVDLAGATQHTVSLGGFPHGLAEHDGVLYVTDRASSAVRRFRWRDWQELAPMAAGDVPHAVAVLTDGTVAVADAGSSTLRVGVEAWGVSALPESVAAGGDRIATAGALGGLVEVFDRAGALRVYAEVGGRPVRVAFDPQGERVAAALSAVGAVAIVDVGGAVRRITVGGVPDGLAFSRDGQWLYVSDLNSGRLTAIEVARGRASAIDAGGVSTGALLVVPGPGAMSGGERSLLVRQ